MALGADPWHAVATLDGAGRRVGRRVEAFRNRVEALAGLNGLRRLPGVSSSQLHAWSLFVVPYPGEAAASRTDHEPLESTGVHGTSR